MLYRVEVGRIITGTKILTLVFCLSSFSAVYADIQIKHDQIGQAKSGQRIGVNSGISDKASGIKRVRAYFKADGEQRWHFAPLRNAEGGKAYSGLLPAPDVQTKKVDYRLMAVNGKNQTAKTEVFTIHIDADKDALARLRKKPPTDIKIDVSDIQEIRDQYRKINSHRKITEADRLSETKQNSEPSPDSRIEVRSEYRPDVIDVPGFQDYIDLYFTGPAEAFGVTAGIVDPALSVAGVSGAAATADTVVAVAASGSSTAKTATGATGKTAAGATGAFGGIGLGPVLGGIAVAGGVVAAGGGSSGGSGHTDTLGDSGGGGGSTTPTQPNEWSSRAQPADPAPGESVTVFVNLNTGSGVTVTYSVSGTDGYSDSGSDQTDTGGEVQIFIPGGGTSVTDTVTVAVPEWGSGFNKTWSYMF